MRSAIYAPFREEEVALSDYRVFAGSYEQVGYFLEEVYQKKRIHSAFDYLTPVEFEAGCRQAKVGGGVFAKTGVQCVQLWRSTTPRNSDLRVGCWVEWWMLERSAWRVGRARTNLHWGQLTTPKLASWLYFDERFVEYMMLRPFESLILTGLFGKWVA